MNNTVLIGRLVRDVELKFIPSSGTAVANFTLAIDKDLSKEKKQEFENKGQPTADFIPVVVFGKSAENCANYLKKGIMTSVIGRISTGSYTTKDGDKRYTTEVIANKVEFLEWADSKKNTQEDDFDSFDGDDVFEPTDSSDIPF
jgi:single-strand DNA-binding protein